MIKFGRLVTADLHGAAILAALCALADHLDRHGAPIDYQRRRELAAEIELLDPAAWTVMCRAGGTPAGGSWKLAHARLWLWETLTGSLPRQAPRTLRLDSPEFLGRHSRFALRLPAPTVRRLNEHARHLLDAHGCRHEPLTWSPSADAISLGQLPGPDPDAINPIRVHAALARQQTPRQTAADLGITPRAPALPRTQASPRNRRPLGTDRAAASPARHFALPRTATQTHRPGQLAAPDRDPLRHQPQDHPRRARRTRHPDPGRPTTPPREPASNLAVASIPKAPAGNTGSPRCPSIQDQCPSSIDSYRRRGRQARRDPQRAAAMTVAP